MWAILTPALDFIKTKLGKLGMLIVSFFFLGVYAVIEYPKYFVTPAALKASQHEIMVSVRLVELRQIRNEQSALIKEQYDLEDTIYELQSGGQTVKPRLANRLTLVKDRLAELIKLEAQLINFLEGSKNE